MRLKYLSFICLGLIVAFMVSTGCEKAETTETAETKPKAPVHDHPPHGPNHGHIFDLDSSDYQGEWAKYKDNNIIRMFIVDAEGKKNVPVKVDSFIVRPKAGEGDVTFELKAEDADADGKTATYMLDDQDLTIAIPLGVDIEIKMGDQTMKGEIKAHKPLDH